MTATHVGHTPPTTTDYRPHPESTDSEFNVLQQAYARRGVEMEKLRVRISELEVESTSLREHLDADHAMLCWEYSRPAFENLPQHRAVNATAMNAGPEVVYDWSQDEDAVEYKFPFNGASSYHGDML